jgi:hypothetical protein
MEISKFYDLLISNPDVANAVAALGSAVLAAVACIISVISLYVASSTLKHQREHNRLSVRPLANITVGDFEDWLYVKLENNGTGPLLIKVIRVIGATDPSEPLINCMPELDPKVSWTNFIEESSGRSMQPGGEIPLIELSSESSSSQAQFALSRDRVREALGKLKVEVEYTDIYGSKLPLALRDLDWFHRMLPEAHQEKLTKQIR